MLNSDIIRAGKNEEQRSSLPTNPTGMIELSDANMESIAGGTLDPNAFKPQLAAQPTLQGNAAAIGGPGSVTIGSPIVQPQLAIPTQNLFSF